MGRSLRYIIGIVALVLFGLAASPGGDQRQMDYEFSPVEMRRPTLISIETAGGWARAWYVEGDKGRISTVENSGSRSHVGSLPSNAPPIALAMSPGCHAIWKEDHVCAAWVAQADNDTLYQVAAAGQITEFPLSPGRGAPIGVVVTPDNTVWIGRSAAHGLTAIKNSGEIVYVPMALHGVPRVLASAPDGTIWFIESNRDYIGRLAKDKTVSEFRVMPTAYTTDRIRPTAAKITCNPVMLPSDGFRYGNIAVDRSGNAWLTRQCFRNIGDAIIRVSPEGSMRTYWMPTRNGGLAGLVYSGYGALWFTEFAANKIGILGTSDHRALEFEVPRPGAGPLGIADDEISVWYSEYRAGKIGRHVFFVPKFDY